MARQDLTGAVLGDTYTVLRCIGEGSMGAVYEAQHRRLPRRFAVKVLHPQLGQDGRAVARFYQEARVTSQLGHRGIVEVVDFNTTVDGAPYIVMELLRGEDLAQRLERRGRLSVEQLAPMLCQAGSALDAAHLRGVVHRDLKPQNLFIRRDEDGGEAVKVLDFGISKILSAPGGLTSADTVVGTPFYMAPEQAEGRADAVGPTTDVFAMGVILYQALSGSLPFVGETIPALLYQIVHQKAPPLGQHDPRLAGAVEQVVSRALRKDPAARFASMAALVQAFETASAKKTSKNNQLYQKVKSHIPRRRLVLLAGLSVGAVVTGGLGYRLWRAGQLPVQHHDRAPQIKGLRVTATAHQADSQPSGPHSETLRTDAGSRPDKAAPPDLGPDLPATPDLSARQSPPRPVSRRRTSPRRRTAPPRKRQGRLTIHTRHHGRTHWANVTVDGRPVGESPIHGLALPVGTHQVTVHRAGFRRTTVTVRVQPATMKTVTIDLLESNRGPSAAP